ALERRRWKIQGRHAIDRGAEFSILGLAERCALLRELRLRCGGQSGGEKRQGKQGTPKHGALD
ncbi:MAG TPA: hypothetical protein VF991_02515, partial [Reyranella sp.]